MRAPSAAAVIHARPCSHVVLVLHACIPWHSMDSIRVGDLIALGPGVSVLREWAGGESQPSDGLPNLLVYAARGSNYQLLAKESVRSIRVRSST